jgi:hypothetical protein
VSLLVLLDLQSNSLFLVSVFLFVLFLHIHTKISKNSLMGRDNEGSCSTRKVDDINTLPNFKQVYGELLKDAWVRINKINKPEFEYLWGREISPLLFLWFGTLV